MRQTLLTTALLLVAPLVALAQPSVQTGISTYHGHYSEWMANSVSTTVYWHYDISLQAEAQMDSWLAYPDNTTDAVRQAVGNYATLIASDGTIYSRNSKTLGTVDQLDNIRPGHFMMEYYAKIDGKQSSKYTVAADRLLGYMGKMTRTLSSYTYGPWQHKASYLRQVWLDGIFMGLPFYTLAGPETHQSDREEYFTDAASQMHLADSVTYDAETRLWKHAWDETNQMDWATKKFNKPYAAKEAADKTTGRSAHTWGRALGWFAMACMEVMDNMDTYGISPTDSRRQTVLSLYQRIMRSVVAYQDSASGLWYDVMDVDKDDPDYSSLSVKRQNYLEATCSAMFTFSLLKGARMGWLSSDSVDYLSSGKRAYCGIVSNLLGNSGATLQLNNCCEVGGLGGSSNRDGSYAYYMSENVKTNDPKGTGPFIWASLEAERIGYDMASNSFSGTATSIANPVSPAVVSTRLYNLSGQRVNSDYKGFVIKQTRRADGSTVSVKTYLR